MTEHNSSLPQSNQAHEDTVQEHSLVQANVDGASAVAQGQTATAATGGGIAVGGNVQESTLITGDQNTVLTGNQNTIYQYFFNPKALVQDVLGVLKEHRWLLFTLILLELLQTILFLRYQERFLLPQPIYWATTLLLGMIIWYWSKVIQSYSVPLKSIKPLAMAGAVTLIYSSLLGEQVWFILYPAQIPSEKFGIAVATFGNGPDFRITQRGRQISGLIYGDLDEAVAKLPEISDHVALKTMGIVHNVEQGRQDGKRIGADLVIWGQILEQDGGVVVNFQILQTPGMIDNPAFPQVLPVTEHYVQGSLDIKNGDSLTVKQITEQQSIAITAFSLGLYYYSKPDYQQAAQRFKLAVDYLEKAQESAGVTDLGLVLLYLGRSYIQLTEYQKALEAFNRAAQYRPDDSALYVGQAYIYRILGQAEQQQRALEKVIALGQSYQSSPNPIPALYNSGIAYEALGNQAAALREYEAILKSDPTFFSAYLSAGRVLIRLKRFDEAQKKYQQAQTLVQSDPTRQIWLSLDLGRLYEWLGQPDAALQEYKRARDLSPTLATPYFYLAMLYQQLGLTDAAFLNYRELTKVSYNPAWAHEAFGRFLFSIGDYQATIDEYLEALRYPTYNNSLTYVNLGQAYTRVNDEPKALDAFEKALRNPGSNAAYIRSLYGNMLDHFHHTDKAISQYEKSLELDKSVAFETRVNLAGEYEATGEFTKAKSLYEALLDVQNQLTDEQRRIVQERLQAIKEK